MRDQRPLVLRPELLNDPLTKGFPPQPPKLYRLHPLLRIHAGMLQAPFGQDAPSVEGHGIETEHDLIKVVGQGRAGRYVSSWKLKRKERESLRLHRLKVRRIIAINCAGNRLR